MKLWLLCIVAVSIFNQELLVASTLIVAPEYTSSNTTSNTQIAVSSAKTSSSTSISTTVGVNNGVMTAGFLKYGVSPMKPGDSGTFNAYYLTGQPVLSGATYTPSVSSSSSGCVGHKVKIALTGSLLSGQCLGVGQGAEFNCSGTYVYGYCADDPAEGTSAETTCTAPTCTIPTPTGCSTMGVGGPIGAISNCSGTIIAGG